jgi:hypothetical protein
LGQFGIAVNHEGDIMVIEFLVLAGIAVGVVYHYWRKKEEKNLPGRQHP